MDNVTEFWNSVGATNADAEYLADLILERSTPIALSDLVNHLIDWRLQAQLKSQAEVDARRAQRYQPRGVYRVGDQLYFPALDGRAGVVKKIRAGDNPRYGEFQVIAVQLDGETKAREFAAGFAHAHALNQDHAAQNISALTDVQARAQYGEGVRKNLARRLNADKEFICVGDQYFLKGLLTKIPEGYLNIAEAAIEQANDALPTTELVKVLELPPNVKKTGVTFSLAVALAQDARFEDVGRPGAVRWFLTRLEPPEVRERPALLEMPNDRVVPLAPELETIAADLFLETDLNNREDTAASTRQELTLVLTYPHRRAGTLPMVPSVRAFLPAFINARLKISFVDAATQERFAGFAVAEGNYVAGLSAWYAARHLQPGALVTLRKHVESLSLTIEYQPQRERSLWMRVAKAQNGELTFAQEKRPLAHRCDDEMLIMIGDAAGIDSAAEHLRQSHASLDKLLQSVFPELAKLSGAGRVHAKTLYSAVNFVRRAGLRAVMTALAESRAFTPVGGGYFGLNEAQR